MLLPTLEIIDALLQGSAQLKNWCGTQVLAIETSSDESTKLDTWVHKSFQNAEPMMRKVPTSTFMCCKTEMRFLREFPDMVGA